MKAWTLSIFKAPRTAQTTRHSADKFRFERGFTLAELMISLLILAEIATFTIPKIIMAQQLSMKKTVFREVLGTLAEAQHLAKVSGDGKIISRMNAVKVCSTNAMSEGCWTHTLSTAYWWDERNGPGVIMHNGATIAGFDDMGPSNGYDMAVVDWNGAAGPNAEGDDQLLITFCYNKTVGFSGYCPRTNVDDYLYSSAWAANAAAHQALWAWIYQ